MTYKNKLKQLDSEISKINSAIKELDNADLKAREDNLKKLFEAHYKMANDMYRLGYFIYDTEIQKFYTTPDVFNIPEVSNFVGTLVNNDEDKEIVTRIGHKLTDNVTFNDFKDAFLKGGPYSLERTLLVYEWDTESFMKRFESNYSGMKQTCGLLEALEQDILDDIKRSCLSIEIQFGYAQHKESSNDVDSEPISADKIYIKHIELSRDANKLVYLASRNYENDKIPFDDMSNKLSAIQDIYNNCVINICIDESGLMIALNTFSIAKDDSAKTDLQIKLDTLNTQRRVAYRQHIYNDMEEVELKPIDTTEETREWNSETEKDEDCVSYNHYHMKSLRKFWTTSNIEVENVQKVVVLKRNESKVKLRIFVTRKFWADSEGNLLSSPYGRKDVKKIFLPMYIDKLVDPRLYIDFVVKYKEATSEGLLDTSDAEYLDKINYIENRIYNNQSRSVSNWKWLFPEEVYSSYNVSELNLIEW